MSRIELTGRLTGDPEMSATPSGLGVAQLRLAIPRRRRNGDDQGAVYVNVTAFDGRATERPVPRQGQAGRGLPPSRQAAVASPPSSGGRRI
jgi:hypothetical protein